MGLSENRVYSQWNSHLIGIMISKTIGFRGTLFSDTPIYRGDDLIERYPWVPGFFRPCCELSISIYLHFFWICLKSTHPNPRVDHLNILLESKILEGDFFATSLPVYVGNSSRYGDRLRGKWWESIEIGGIHVRRYHIFKQTHMVINMYYIYTYIYIKSNI